MIVLHLLILLIVHSASEAAWIVLTLRIFLPNAILKRVFAGTVSANWLTWIFFRSAVLSNVAEATASEALLEW